MHKCGKQSFIREAMQDWTRELLLLATAAWPMLGELPLELVRSRTDAVASKSTVAAVSIIVSAMRTLPVLPCLVEALANAVSLETASSEVSSALTASCVREEAGKDDNSWNEEVPAELVAAKTSGGDV